MMEGPNRKGWKRGKRGPGKEWEKTYGKDRDVCVAKGWEKIGLRKINFKITSD